MKIDCRILWGVVLLSTLLIGPLRADNFLSNTDLKDSIQSWHGDGTRVFLKPDNTEGAEGDPGVFPVIRLSLSRGSSRSVYQNFETRDKPTVLHVSVEVLAAPEFARSKFDNDYSVPWKADGTTWYWSAIAIPHADFWIRLGGSSWCYKLANLKAGTWVTLSGEMKGLPTDQSRIVCYCVPPGTGAVYIRKPSVTP